jgi:hypothetical protein
MPSDDPNIFEDARKRLQYHGDTIVEIDAWRFRVLTEGDCLL